MAISPTPVEIAQFGDFEVDLRSRELRSRNNRASVRLPDQSFEVLAMLLQHPGELVTREDIRKRLWPADTFVDFDHGLNNAVKRLRDALRDSAETPQFVETLPRRGYRFIAQVKRLDRPEQTSPATETARGGSLFTKLKTRQARLALAVTLMGLAILLVATDKRIWSQPGTTRRVMLAVLPFENLSERPQEDYFSDGLTDELITQVGGLEPARLGVIARTSAMQYKHAGKSSSQVGHELGVDYILEGTVRREGSLVRVAIKLVQVKDQTLLWTQSYERNLGHILAFHGEVARDVARRIQVQLTPQERAALSAVRPVDPQAYEAYLKGRYFWNKFTNPDFRKSVEYFQQAIEKDPNYAPAYASLAASYANLVEFGEPPMDLYLKSEECARKAIELDGASSDAYATLAWSLFYYHHDWEAAQRAILQAIELNPSNSYAHMLYAKYLAALGRFGEAREQAERAHQADPVSLAVNVVLAQVFFYERQYNAALEQLNKMLEMDRNFPPTYWTLAHVYEATGKQDKACENMLKTFDIGSGHVPWFTELDRVRVRSGWRAAWEQWIQGVLDPTSTGYLQPYYLVGPYLNLGHDGEAVAWLAKAAEVHDVEIVFINVDPRFDRLRTNARFEEIVSSLHFPK
jgi:TolB-like protein/DNA-binding winged helix-turn-helix (wHTH) protein/Tfp pilus assembly protein PilF